MTAGEVAARVQMPHSSTLRRLNTLIKRGLIQRIEDRYYLEPTALQLSAPRSLQPDPVEGLAVLARHWSKLDE